MWVQSILNNIYTRILTRGHRDPNNSFKCWSLDITHLIFINTVSMPKKNTCKNSSLQSANVNAVQKMFYYKIKIHFTVHSPQNLSKKVNKIKIY